MGEDGEELPPGQDGMIYFEGAPFEYHNDPAKTASSRNDRGWSTLGDMGHLDADGYLFLADRGFPVIRVSGGDQLPELPARPRQPRAHGADRHAECPGRRGVVEFGPDAQRDQLALAAAQRGQRFHGFAQLD